MKKINLLIDKMKQTYDELSSANVQDIDINSLKELRDFSKGYSLDIQELIYGFEER